jgi:hypothetical protein
MKAGLHRAREEGLDESRPYNFISGKDSPATLDTSPNLGIRVLSHDETPSSPVDS